MEHRNFKESKSRNLIFTFVIKEENNRISTWQKKHLIPTCTTIPKTTELKKCFNLNNATNGNSFN